MDQDTDEWRTLLTRANQLFRATRHPAALLPVEGRMPSLDSATGWLNFVDARGQIRHHRFGEGEYEMSEMILQRLLAEAGGDGTDQDLVSVDATGVEAAADWASLRSPENYLGSERTENFALFPGPVRFEVTFLDPGVQAYAFTVG